MAIAIARRREARQRASGGTDCPGGRLAGAPGRPSAVSRHREQSRRPPRRARGDPVQPGQALRRAPASRRRSGSSTRTRRGACMGSRRMNRSRGSAQRLVDHQLNEARRPGGHACVRQRHRVRQPACGAQVQVDRRPVAQGGSGGVQQAHFDIEVAGGPERARVGDPVAAPDGVAADAGKVQRAALAGARFRTGPVLGVDGPHPDRRAAGRGTSVRPRHAWCGAAPPVTHRAWRAG